MCKACWLEMHVSSFVKVTSESHNNYVLSWCYQHKRWMGVFTYYCISEYYFLENINYPESDGAVRSNVFVSTYVGHPILRITTSFSSFAILWLQTYAVSQVHKSLKTMLVIISTFSRFHTTCPLVLWFWTREPCDCTSHSYT